MNLLYEIVRNIIVIILVSSLLELLLPDGRIKPFVRFAIGLFVLIAILSPVLGFLYSDHDFSLRFWDSGFSSSDEEKFLEKGGLLHEEIMQQADQERIREKMQGQLDAILILIPGVEDAQTTLSMNTEGVITEARIIVRSGSDKKEYPAGKVDVFPALVDESNPQENEICHKIHKIIKNLYGLDPGLVKIEFEGGQ
ncbi:MAG TPA: stage III sporulation protein AF [Syntrophomonadaceae bacterium]|nr:stage III sporulation protein AF [Syntrophomonadaceae bacterium]